MRIISPTEVFFGRREEKYWAMNIVNCYLTTCVTSEVNAGNAGVVVVVVVGVDGTVTVIVWVFVFVFVFVVLIVELVE